MHDLYGHKRATSQNWPDLSLQVYHDLNQIPAQSILAGKLGQIRGNGRKGRSWVLISAYLK
jgi:hypothetical protein